MTHRHQTISTLNYFRLSGGSDVDPALQSSLTLLLTTRPLASPLQLCPRPLPPYKCHCWQRCHYFDVPATNIFTQSDVLPEVSSLSLLFLWLGVKIHSAFVHKYSLNSCSLQIIGTFTLITSKFPRREKHDHLPRRWLPPYWLYSFPPHSPTAGTSEACCATLLKDHSILWSEADFSRFRRLCLCSRHNIEKKAWAAIIMLSDCIVRSIWRRWLAPH